MSEGAAHDPGSADAWDRLRHPVVPDRDVSAGERPPGGGPGRLQLMAAAWGELVAMLGVWTATLLGLVAFGYPVVLACFPWAAATAVGWWVTASAILLVVRRATPGMVMAGLRFSRQPRPSKLPLILATAMALAVTLGVPVFLGARSAMQKAGAAELQVADR